MLLVGYGDDGYGDEREMGWEGWGVLKGRGGEGICQMGVSRLG